MTVDEAVARERHQIELESRLGRPMVAGNGVRLARPRDSGLESLLEVVESAHDHVNVETCLGETELREALLERLVARARAGVRVSLLHAGSGGAGSADTSPPSRLRAAGATIAEYGALSRWVLQQGGTTGRALTRTTVVVDGRIAGVACGLQHAGHPAHTGHGPGDPIVFAEGPIVRDFQRRFISSWQRHARVALPQARFFPPLTGAGLQSAALVDPAGFEDALSGAIGLARHSALLCTADCSLPAATQRLLGAARARGVAVELLSANGRLSRGLSCVVDGVWAGGCVAMNRLDRRLADPPPTLVVVDPHVAAALAQLLRDAARPLVKSGPRGGRRTARFPASRLPSSGFPLSGFPSSRAPTARSADPVQPRGGTSSRAATSASE